MEETQYRAQLVNYFKTFDEGDRSIFTIYNPQTQSQKTYGKQKVLNIMKLDNEISPYNKEIKETPISIQDLLDHPTIADPAYSIFKENVRLF